MTHAAFQATYSDWKLIKTRKVVQIVFEVPVEQAGLAYEVLDGMPNFGSEVWCAIARLDLKKEVMTSAGLVSDPSDKSPRSSPDKTGGTHKSAAQRAGILCGDPSFRRFLNEQIGDCETADGAAEIVRAFCRVTSRKHITKDQPEWRDLLERFKGWELEVKVVPA